jgi:hypothetical protein
MPRPIRIVLRFVAFVAVVAAIGSLVGPTSSSESPYLSALSDLTASSAFAANPHCRSACEFASPGFVCTEGSGRCVRSSGGCITKSC